MSLTVGTKLGPYEILAKLGAGGMGEVWKACDTRLDRAVAIKRLKADHGTRFEREARAIAALNHPHICQIYDIGPDYFVMEYVEGAPVKGPLPPDEVVKLALQITGALEAAHAVGIIHRDLKPDNVMVGAAGVKVLDFGLAKQAMAGKDETETSAGTIAGTAAYMSPEQARGDTLDQRSDIFSLGALLYELLAGRRPFPGSSIAETLSGILRDEPRAFEAPPELARIVQRCLRKPREERFASMADLRAALERAHLATDRASIAVLPFANMSRDAADEYFSDGLGEEIINSLVKVPGLRVIARTSSFAFKGQHKDIREIAGVLGVTNVLEGSVRRAGDRIRVTAQLVAASDGSHLWSERYDRQMEDIFTMQDEIAAAIASALELRFAPQPTERPRRQPNLQAYEAYLRYRHHQWGFTEESLRRSRECLEQAIAI
ncbi:MAG: protein kinase domain-containing protein, partial [Planctomycetota bacterium]